MCNTTLVGQSPFKHDIVGSFLRPQALKQAREQYANGSITDEQLRAVEDSEIIELVNKQRAVGLKAVTDGEFRRSWWHLDFMWGFDGIEKAAVPQGYVFHGVESRPETARVNGKIGYASHPFIEHFTFLQQACGDELIARQTIPAPAQLLLELQRLENQEALAQHYPNYDELLQDIAAAYQSFIKAIYEAGCRSLQIDDCTWGMLCDEGFIRAREAEGVIVGDIGKVYAELNKRAIAGAPDDLVITSHVCRGNYKSTWAGAGGYDPVASTLFSIDYDAFYLEFDTERAGSFEPLKHVQQGQKVVLGLVSSKIGEPEQKEAIIARIREAAQYVPLEQLCLSPQCGFASTEEGNLITEQQQWDKLKLIKEISDEVWGKQ